MYTLCNKYLGVRYVLCHPIYLHSCIYSSLNPSLFGKSGWVWLVRLRHTIDSRVTLLSIGMHYKTGPQHCSLGFGCHSVCLYLLTLHDITTLEELSHVHYMTSPHLKNSPMQVL